MGAILEHQVEDAKVLFEYEAENDDELSLAVGAVVEVTCKNTEEDGW